MRGFAVKKCYPNLAVLFIEEYVTGRVDTPLKFGWGRWKPPLETLNLCQTKICDFAYPISDLPQNFLPYLRPGPYLISFA